ncbi:MAG: DNA polymerase IV, partial [Nitriliruptoraceae bacterium]
MTDVSILHLDMDAFFASVEQRDDPRLQGKPVAVGGGSHRGVVAAASYEARHYGIRSAMPMAQARARCPHLVVVPPRGAVYRAVSDQVMRHVRAVTPIIEQLSLDEAFLDVSGAHRLFGSSMSIAQRLRSTIRAEVGLPASVGIATTKSVAKLLSALAKPDGCLMWPAGEVPERLRNLHVAALWGAGPQTVRTLTANGIVKVADLVDSDPVVLARLIGPVAAQRLQALGR